MPGRSLPMRLLVIALFLACLVPPASAQMTSGNLYGTATDNEGNPLPGVTVTLSGVGAPQVQVTNAEGQFRFLGLSPARYQLGAALEGFSTVEYPNVTIHVGRNTTLEASLSPAIEETITVTSESPLLDERKIAAGTTVTQIELEKIPTARDPWSILQSTPGVLVDRINVGGNESGQQPNVVAGGATDGSATWMIDGVQITDMAAIGASPTYYGFDAFEEMQFTTGGSDASLATAGVTVNLITKRGTNEWRGSGRYFRGDSADFSEAFGQATPVPDRSSRVDGTTDYGVELGGPIWRDKLWIWANYGRNEIDLLTVDDQSDFTDLENYAAKLNAQLSASNRLTGFYARSEISRSGVGRGDPFRPAETTWNQTGPTDIYKLEDTHIFNSNFYLTGLWSHVDGGFGLVPQSDGIPFLNADSVWSNGFKLGETTQDATAWRVDGSYFFNTGATSHELRFGTDWRTVDTTESFRMPSGQTFFDGGVVDQQLGGRLFRANTQESRSDLSQTRTGFYVQDTLTAGPLTANIGLRYDRDTATINPVTIAGNQELTRFGAPSIFSFPETDPGFEWETISPRVGVTYALGAERKTLLRASFARFADQLGTGIINFDNPSAPDDLFFRAGVFEFVDDPFFDQDFFFQGFFVDPNAPAYLDSPNQIDPGLSSPITSELVLNVEHALLPEFVIGATVTLRNQSDLIETRPLVDDFGTIRPAMTNDYFQAGVVEGVLPDGTTYSVPYFDLDPFLDQTGFLLTNGRRETDYQGVSLTFNKRLSNRWLLRGHLTWQDWEWEVPAGQTGQNPTDQVDGAFFDPVRIGDTTGTLYAPQSTNVDADDAFLGSRWQYSVSGLYQVAPDRPWGFNVAANLFGREGYPQPYFVKVDGLSQAIDVTGSDPARLENPLVVDLRLDKDFSLGGGLDLTLSAEAFNIFDEDYVLQRNRDLSDGQDDFVRETLSPRVFRLGVRLNWN